MACPRQESRLGKRYRDVAARFGEVRPACVMQAVHAANLRIHDPAHPQRDALAKLRPHTDALAKLRIHATG